MKHPPAHHPQPPAGLRRAGAAMLSVPAPAPASSAQHRRHCPASPLYRRTNRLTECLTHRLADQPAPHPSDHPTGCQHWQQPVRQPVQQRGRALQRASMQQLAHRLLRRPGGLPARWQHLSPMAGPARWPHRQLPQTLSDRTLSDRTLSDRRSYPLSEVLRTQACRKPGRFPEVALLHRAFPGAPSGLRQGRERVLGS